MFLIKRDPLQATGGPPLGRRRVRQTPLRSPETSLV